MGANRFVVVWALILVGCVEPNHLVCDDIVCPASFRCVDGGGCRPADQLAACEGLVDGDECTFAASPGRCVGGVCTVAACGNGVVEPPEPCDDGNQFGGDGCNGSCTSDETCGNGFVELAEECDCGDATHPGPATCMGTSNGGSECATTCVIVRCGNGIVEADEVCDDGNQDSGDGCNFDCKSNEACGNGILDYFAGELCDDGDRESHDGCASQCQSETLTWREWLPDAKPSIRIWAGMAYDAAHGQVVMMGGEDLLSNVLDETWIWDGARWIQKITAVRPIARRGAAMAYDARRQRVVLFGGYGSGVNLADTWEWDGGSWNRMTPAVSPPAREVAALEYDAVRGTVVLFGGDTGNGQGLQDTWTWDGVTWTQHVQASPPPKRAYHTLTFDPIAGNVVMFGGSGSSGTLNDTWIWNGAMWTMATPVNKPAARYGHAAAYDLGANRVTLFGGQALGMGTAGTNDTWQWTGSNWEVQSQDATPPPTRYFHTMAYDQRYRTAVVFGGNQNTQTYLDDTWLRIGTDWSAATIPADKPSPVYSPMHAYDAGRARLVVFAGSSDDNTWEWDGTRWLSIDAANPPPTFNSGAMAYFASRKAVVMYDGTTTWEWDGVAWTELSPATSPPARYSVSMAYDSKRDVIVMFGGYGINGILADTWEWDGATWNDVTPTVSPPPREYPAMSFDAHRGVTVLFGGYLASDVAADTWEWDGTTWTERVTPVAPIARGEAALAYDAARGTTILFGGYGELSLRDLWEWDGEQWKELGVIGGPVARYGSVFAYDAARAQIVLFGGYATFSLFDEDSANDTWTLGYESEQPAETCVGYDTDGDLLAGCADDDCAGECTPVCAIGMTGCDTSWPRCGDGVCLEAESCGLCPQDCTGCAVTCGDHVCNAGETAASCPGDCP